MSKYTQAELRKIYATERRNWQKNVSKARKKGINVSVEYPAIPKHIKPESIANIISKHNAWHYKTFGKPKKQSKTQKQFVPTSPKYQTEKKQKKERIKQPKETKTKRKPRSEPALPTTDYIEPEPAPEPIEYYGGDIDETEFKELNEIQNEIEAQFTYIPEEGYWVDNDTGEIVSSDQIASYIAGDIADVDDYAEEFINEQLEKLSTTHEGSARFLNEQFKNLTPEQKSKALERLEQLDETEIEDLAVELYYSSASGGTKAAAKLFRIISPDNDMKTAKEFMNRLYEESEDDSPYKRQAIENRKIKTEIQKYHRKKGFKY